MVTMRDVAALAGVSQATVSYALNGDPMISEATRSRVMAAAQELDYAVNLSARNLKSGKSGAIGLVVQEIANPYLSQLADAISEYALGKGLQTVIQQTLYRRESETTILEHVISAFCDAVIFSPSKLTSRQIKAQLHGKPALLLSAQDENPEYDVLQTPGKRAMREATDYLFASGCRNPVFFGMPYIPLTECVNPLNSATTRVVGYESSLANHGMKPGPQQFINPPDWSPGTSRQTMLDYIDYDLASNYENSPRNKYGNQVSFDAVVCINDAAALGVIRALIDRNISIPDQVSVIGFDGISQGAFIAPSLSTVAFDFNDMARQAIDTLVMRLDEASGKTQTKTRQQPQRLTAHYQLLQRESTKSL